MRSVFLLCYFRYASCRGAKVYKNHDGSNRGSGFVRFGDETDQQRAFIEMNRKLIHGRPMMLKMAPVRVKRPKYGAGGEYDPSNYYRQYQDYYNSSQWSMYDYQQKQQPADNSTPSKEQDEKASIVLNGLEIYADFLTPEEADDTFMEDSEEVYNAMRESLFFPAVHTAAVTFDDL
uniref:tRNA selenocysteine-associated protein 1 n=1 Tax=Romanomermis culicivorax TaxID=13658 RepID=A0A915IJB1_ROMCU